MASSSLANTVTKTLSATLSSTSATSTKVAAQGGVLEGVNPVVYNPSNPLILFIIQAGIILMYVDFPWRLSSQVVQFDLFFIWLTMD